MTILSAYNINYEYIKSDKDGAPAIVFLHGWGGGVLSFLPVAEQLGGTDRLLLDFAGFGASRADRVRTLEDYCDDVLELMDEIGMEKAVLVGHSFGCRVGACIAAYHPERVVGFVITDGAGLRPRRGISYYLKIFLFKLRRKLGLDVSGAGSEDYRALEGVMKKTFVNVVNRYTEKECAKIACPTLTVWGKYDADTPFYMAKRFKRLIRDCEIVTLDGGHFCYIQNLAVYTAVVRSFVEGVWYGVV